MRSAADAVALVLSRHLEGQGGSAAAIGASTAQLGIFPSQNPDQRQEATPATNGHTKPEGATGARCPTARLPRIPGRVSEVLRLRLQQV